MQEWRVGSFDPLLGQYVKEIEEYACYLEVEKDLRFHRAATLAQLRSYYTVASVFLCVSEHEGFCVPLLESMYHRLPIVAYANTAVPETVQGAGLVLPDKEPARVAAAIDRVLRDGHLRAVLADSASERVETFALPRVRAGFAAALDAACAA